MSVGKAWAEGEGQVLDPLLQSLREEVVCVGSCLVEANGEVSCSFGVTAPEAALKLERTSSCS